jgi:hypothetical protein
MRIGVLYKSVLFIYLIFSFVSVYITILSIIKTNDGQVQTETRRRCKEGRKGKGRGGDTKRGFRKRKGKEQGKEKGWIRNERQNQPVR